MDNIDLDQTMHTSAQNIVLHWTTSCSKQRRIRVGASYAL